MSKKKNPDKLTFNDIFEDFRKRYPRLSKSVTHWVAYDVGRIKIFTIDDLVLTYDYDIHQAIITLNLKN